MCLAQLQNRRVIMNFGTKLRTVLAIATSLNTALMATDLTGFNNGTIDLVYKIVSIALNFVIVACVTYYNNDYTETACKYTGMMRLEKEQQKQNFIGEDFFEQINEEFEEENMEEE